MPKHIVFIGPHQAMCDTAKRLGINYSVIDTNENYQVKPSPDSDVFLTNYKNKEKLITLIDYINSYKKIDGILSLTENGLIPAAVVSDHLGFTSNIYDVANKMKDKALMRKNLNKSISNPVNYKVIENNIDLKHFSNRNGFPFIIKPLSGVGSVGVKKIENKEQLLNIVINEKMIAEDFISGSEYSVEAFTSNGKHNIISITEKMLIGGEGQNAFTEKGHLIPANLDTKTITSITSYITNILNAINYKNGPSHTEIKINENGIYLIETHNRIGGDRISELVKISTGIDLIELSILSSIHHDVNIPDIIHRKYSCISFFQFNNGIVKEINGLQDAKNISGILDVNLSIKTGEEIKEITNSFTRHGFVISCSDEYYSVKEICENAIKKINITY